MFVPGQGSFAAVSGRESSNTCSSLTSDDVHELHLGLQPHSSETPLPRLRKSESHANQTQCSLNTSVSVRQDAIYILMCICILSAMNLCCLMQIVCRSCSRNRYPLKYMKDRMAKVCDHCYNELKKRGGKTRHFWNSSSICVSVCLSAQNF